MSTGETGRGKKSLGALSSSSIMTLLVVSMVLVSMIAGLIVFIMIYRRSMIQNAVITSEQAAVQVSNIVGNYTDDISGAMKAIEGYYSQEGSERDDAINYLVMVRPDVVAVTSYDGASGTMLHAWTGRQVMKETILENLSYDENYDFEAGELYLSSPHVESLLVNYYPWVVSVHKRIKTAEGREEIVVMDIRFSQIASYVDDVGIGRHGYCFIMDQEGGIIYHPQQQLIFAGLKEEYTSKIAGTGDGSLREQDVIYTIKTRLDSGWRIVGVSFADEMVTARVQNVVALLGVLLLAVLIVTFISSLILSRMISQPIKGLVEAMGEFEKRAADFTYQPVHGSSEIVALSDSFGHMVVRIQELMMKVRSEEITLRKTELRALQAQINPHFLYNTLDSIGWMCEEGKNQEAVEMVNALARLFRISISKGHELITIEKELEHAKSYLKIQQSRYKNQFIYTFDVEEPCLSYYCNKITLQPIIENAIYHGLNRMVDEGLIKIGIHEEGDIIVFTVEDNGVGMSGEQCKSILQKEPGENTGIGIKNVNDRIKIYFGEQYGLSIESEQDVGTLVRITMPKIEEGNYEPK